MAWFTYGDIKESSGLTIQNMSADPTIKNIHITKDVNGYVAKLAMKAPIWVKSVKHDLSNEFAKGLSLSDQDNKYVILATAESQTLSDALKFACSNINDALSDMDLVSLSNAGTVAPLRFTNSASPENKDLKNSSTPAGQEEFLKKMSDLREQTEKLQQAVASGNPPRTIAFKPV